MLCLIDMNHQIPYDKRIYKCLAINVETELLVKTDNWLQYRYTQFLGANVKASVLVRCMILNYVTFHNKSHNMKVVFILSHS